MPKAGPGNYQGKHVVAFNNDSLPFFGGTVFMDDSVHIMQQIKAVAKKDDFLSVDGRVLTIGEVAFGISLHDNGVRLISSTQVDDPKLKTIVKFLNRFYGISKEENPNYYYWRNNGKTIRLRPLHSEEGGTVILVYGLTTLNSSKNDFP
jgi:hypothetical protein